jgi:carnitine-CoA ligase
VTQRKLDMPLQERSLGKVLAAKARQNGERTYLIFEDRRYTYRDADLISNRIANSLVALGIVGNDKVAILSENRPEVLWTYFALAKLGAVAAPINTASRGEQLRYFINAFDAVALVIERGLAEHFLAIREQCPNVGTVILLDDDSAPPGDIETQFGAPVRHYASLEQSADRPLDVEVSFRDLAHIPYTSGTTGPSKGNLATHCSMISGAMAYVEHHGFRPSDILYTCLPLFHMSAYGNCVQALMADAAIALSRRFSARAFWDEIRRFGVTQFTSVGAMSNILWSQPESSRDKEHSVRLCNMIPVMEFAREFEQRFNLKVVSCYGMSDFGPVTFLAPDHPPEKWRSSGRVRSDMAVAILDDDDLPMPAGKSGEICTRALQPWVAVQGYYKLPEATASSRTNFWFHTGDLGYLDADDYLHFVGRRKDAIRRRGENISAYEVEMILLTHPAVAEAAAFAVPAEIGEDDVAVSVVARADMTLDPMELVQFCKGRMAYYMVPRYVDVVGTLPKTQTQKVDKVLLRGLTLDRLPEVWDGEKHGSFVRRGE